MQKIIKYILIFLLAINFIYVLSGVLNFPVYSIDVLSIWLFKTKALFFDPGNFFRILNEHPYSHPQYPVLLPLLYSLLLKIYGYYSENVIVLIYPLLYALILYICYKTLLMLKIQKISALLVTYFYSMFSPLLAMAGRGHAAEADIYIVLGYWLMVLSAFQFTRTKSSKWLYSMILLTMVFSCIKMEGLFMATVFAVLPIKFNKKIIFMSLSALPFVIWSIVRIKTGLNSDLYYLFPGLSELLKRFFDILYYIFREMLKITDWYLFWPSFALLILSGVKNGPFADMILKMAAYVALLYSVNYLFLNTAPSVYVPNSIDRIFMQVSPLYLVIFTLKANKILLEIKKNIWVMLKTQ